MPTDADETPEGPVAVRSIRADQVVLSVASRDVATQTVTGQFVELSESGVRLRPYAIRYLYPHQLDELAGDAGLALVDRWSDWSGTPFDGGSVNHVSVYGRP